MTGQAQVNPTDEIRRSPSDDDPVVLNDLLVLREFEPLLRAFSLDSLDALFSVRADASLGKPGLAPWRQRLRLVIGADENRRVVYLKRYRHPPASVLRQLRQSHRPPRSLAGLEWIRSRELTRTGIPVARAFAFGEEIVREREVRSAVLLAEVPGRSLEKLACEWSAADLTAPRHVLRQTAALVRALHGNGFIHRDLYLAHLFWNENDDTAPLHLIDLLRVTKPRFGMRRWIIKDVASLSFSTPEKVVSSTDRIRWLKAYLGLSKLDASGKRLAYRVIGKAQAIARHDRRRRSRLSRGSQGPRQRDTGTRAS